MPDPDRNVAQTIRLVAYFIWEREGHAQDHWCCAIIETAGRECHRDEETMAICATRYS